jgi:2-oxoisovalerate dehydrogenase E1 component
VDDRAIYSFGLLIRETEQALLKMFGEGLLSGTTHTCLGEEICQISVVRALNDPEDSVLSNHRNHGHFLTYSGDFLGLVAEIMGREAGVCGGIGGSQHLAFRGFHSSGVLGGMTAIGAGHGLAARVRGGPGMVAVMVGDGALGQGLLYEALNLASIWETPVLFVVENNGIAQTTPTARTTAGSIEGRGAAFGMESWRFDDAAPDFLSKVEGVVAHVRAKRRPGWLVIDTMRMGPHSKGDDLRDSFEMAAIHERDPLERMGRRLPAGEREAIERSTREFVQAVCARAKASPPAHRLIARESIFLPPGPDGALEPAPGAPAATVRSDLNRCLRAALERSPRVILLGEDLHDPYGGAFKITAGLSTEFPDRVISTPISEAGVVGAAIGLAMQGWLPVVEIMFADFITLAFDQICNHAVKFPGMFAGVRIPLVIRTPAGARRGYGPTHSQSPENLLCGVPGLTVVFASQRHEPGNLLWQALFNWPYPTVFLEHKLLYGQPVDRAGYRVVEPSPEDAAAALFPTLVRGSARPDVTLVAYGGMVELAEAAAVELESEELEAELVVPSLLSPLPRRTLARWLAGRDRILAVEESHSQNGFAAELGTVLAEEGFRGRFARVGTPPVPIPSARSLEAQVVPDGGRIAEAVLRVLGIG